MISVFTLGYMYLGWNPQGQSRVGIMIQDSLALHSLKELLLKPIRKRICWYLWWCTMMWVILHHTSYLDPYKGTHALGKTASTGQSKLRLMYKCTSQQNYFKLGHTTIIYNVTDDWIIVLYLPVQDTKMSLMSSTSFSWIANFMASGWWSNFLNIFSAVFKSVLSSGSGT